MTKEVFDTIKQAAAGKTTLFSEEEMKAMLEEPGGFECESCDCAFNNEGSCRFAAVYDQPPIFTEEDGCLCGVIADPYGA